MCFSDPFQCKVRPVGEGLEEHQRLEPLCYGARLKELGVVQPGKGLWGDRTVVFQYVKGAYMKDRLFTGVCRDRPRGSGSKWKEVKFRWEMRKMFFTLRVVRQWNRLCQTSCAYPIIGSVQSQVGWGFGLPHLVEDVRGFGLG